MIKYYESAYIFGFRHYKILTKFEQARLCFSILQGSILEQSNYVMSSFKNEDTSPLSFRSFMQFLKFKVI